jgi:signal transduction histidine kinase
MVLDVLAGRDLASVAAEHDTLPRLLEEWVNEFVTAGGHALAARADADETTADHLLAIVAHEIRSPLTSAAIALRLLSGDRLGEEQRVEVGETVAHQLDLLTRLAEDVVDGASVALGREQLHLETVDLQGLIECVGVDNGDDRVHVEPGPPLMVIGDPTRLRQLVDNLLQNARRHGVDGIEVALAREHGHALMTVMNHAREPVSADEASRWFEPFARESSRTGHGLGLYVVRALATAHAGTVGVDCLPCDKCETGQNLRVWLRLPIGGPTPHPVVVSRGPSSIPTQPGTSER